MTVKVETGENDIAIVGMAGHFPGASSVSEFWQNLRDGKSSISQLDRAALLAAGEDPGKMLNQNYVPAAAILKDFDHFDADFFGLSPKEAAIMDPQHRQFLEVAWESLEHAGHPPEKFNGSIGVYAGCGMGSYFYFNLCSNPDLVNDTGMFLLRHTGNDKDFMTTRVSHVFDLHGPSVNVQTACSTSLVATHFACQALLSGECDMALAGGATVELPHGRGYVYEKGEILSPDGQCHAFDHRAEGTVFGSGAGAVVLRRLADAEADGDFIWGVIKGSAINNDGAAKAGYLAPSVDGQAQAIAEAQAVAGITADTVSYVECHGTGTYLGDPIEVAALTQAFAETTDETTDETGFCRIGSVKTNIGHLDTAAGIASLIKTTLALHHGEIPASLGYEKPNPSIDFAASPFQVNDRLTPWPQQQGPRRAGVNSLGVGGTNAHAVLQQAPTRTASEASDWPYHILTVSGRSKTALNDNAARLAQHLAENPDQPLVDIAYTLVEGRRNFEKRRVLVADSHGDAIAQLTSNDPRRVFDHAFTGDNPDIVFMFPGGGAQYAGMARDLYETEPVFKDWMDQGLDILGQKLDYDIRRLWLPEDVATAAADEALKQPSAQLPLIMITEYALAQLWMSWGVTPAALVGHSMGENTAACLAGVMSFEDCIGLVLLRGQLFDSVPSGGMLSIPMTPEDLHPHLGDDLDIAAINAPGLTVVSGPDAALDRLASSLEKQAVECQRIAINIAAHSQMLDPILDRFRCYLSQISLHPPSIPLHSNRSGKPITAAEATDPGYWVNHLRHTVRFSDCITDLAAQPDRVFLEVGPGNALNALARMHESVGKGRAFGSLRHPDDAIADDRYFLTMLARLWALGVEIDWDQIWGEAQRQRVPLPTYAFQRSRYFIEPGKADLPAKQDYLAKLPDIANWAYRPIWRPRLAECLIDVEHDLAQAEKHRWLILMDEAGLGRAVADRLRQAGQTVVELHAGDRFNRHAEGSYALAPERGREGYDQLIQDLMARGLAPDRIVNFWLVTAQETFRPGSSFFHRNQERGFYSLLFLAKALSDEGATPPIHITTVTTGAMQVRSEHLAYPEKATVIGPARVIPRELPGVTAAVLDVCLPQTRKTRFWQTADDSNQLDALALQVLEDLIAAPDTYIAVLRGQKRFVADYAQTEFAAPETPPSLGFEDNGTYLITGGFGGIGLTLAAEAAGKHAANIILLSRTPLPDRADWAAHLRKFGAINPVSKRIQAVETLESLGAQVMVVTADVCNLEDMRAAKAMACERFGAITGVIHAAGVIDDGPLLAKDPAGIEDVFSPKIHGTQVLDQVFADGDLDWLALFSSTSTVTAPAGQVDYVAANAFLNAYANSRAEGKTHVVAINWGLWAEVGMAATAAAGTIAPREFTACDQPMLDQAGFDAAGNRLFETRLSTQTHWMLDDHRTREGAALLPGTGYLELAAEALAAQGEPSAFEIRDLVFLRPLSVPDEAARDIRVTLNRSQAGYDFAVYSQCRIKGRDGFQLNAEAGVSLLPLPSPAAIDLTVIKTRCDHKNTAPNGGTLSSPQEAHLAFGERWKVLQEIRLGDGEGLAHLRLPEIAAGDPMAGYLLHPGLLDLATGWAMALIESYKPDHLWVPMSYSSVKVYGALGGEVHSWVRNAARNHADGDTARFDVTLTDDSGAVFAEITGFTIKRLDQATSFIDLPPPSVSEVIFDEDPDQASPRSVAEARLQHNLSQGISPSEGVVAFKRALASGLPQIIVTSLDLDGLCAQTQLADSSSDNRGQKFDRPQLETDFIAPRTDVERTLAGFWQDLLGVAEVGIDDNFFDLGGHSLIAVRLFAMVRKTYRIDLPISILFEAPTIAACADLISRELGPEAATDKPETTPKPLAVAARRFTHLVPMHTGEGGPKPPFFLVAGMFGNVLNLRHLAHLLSTDRPFYGLQARGLYGDQAPHTSLVEAARDYIAEMRAVQPHGPYLLGGFSGGGITAYEIAHQLEALGEQVALLVMLDTPLPVRRALTARDRLTIQWHDLKAGGLRYPATWLLRRIRWEIARRRSGADVVNTPAAADAFHNEAIEAAFLTAVDSYPMRPWGGRLRLFRPPLQGKWQVAEGRWVDHQRAYVLADNDWGSWVDDLSVVEVPGDHDSMVLEPNVRVLAARMAKAIAEAEEALDQVGPTRPLTIVKAAE